MRDFPEHQPMWIRLPDRLDRISVRAEGRQGVTSSENAVAAFLAAMAWGYGNVGYGRHRARRVLANDKADEKLRSVLITLRDRGAVAAYRRLADRADARLHGLGPSFGTKFLAFCAHDSDRPALILDEMVSTWLLQNASQPLVYGRWHPASYGSYLTLVSGWAAELRVGPEDVEFCIFAAEVAKRPGNQWAV